jgi:broad specificity phosphatase PhoE
VGQATAPCVARFAEYAEPVPTWFLRHGESDANAAGVFAGQGVDSPLTVVGRDQARRAAPSVPTEVEWIVASPLTRAIETAEIVRQVRGIPSRVEIDHRATEYDVGSASGLPTRPMTAIEMVDQFGAEEPDEFALRVRSLLDDLSLREGAGLLVSHAGIGRMIHTLRQGRQPSEFRDQSLPENASLFLI